MSNTRIGDGLRIGVTLLFIVQLGNAQEAANVEHWLRQLASEDRGAQVEAARRLLDAGELQESALVAIIRALGRVGPTANRTCQGILAGRGKRSVPFLVAEIQRYRKPGKHSLRSVRRNGIERCIQVLGAIGHEAAAARGLLRHLCRTDETPSVRIVAARALFAVGDKHDRESAKTTVLSALRSAIAKDDEVACQRGAEGLIELGIRARHAVPLLLDTLASCGRDRLPGTLGVHSGRKAAEQALAQYCAGD